MSYRSWSLLRSRNIPVTYIQSFFNCRSMATQARDYNEALRLLSLLSSNRHVTNLFEKPATSSDGAAPTKPAAKDLNALAIPEMREWLRRAGYSTNDLARLKHIHVAGTKGKGSVSAFATGMLRQYQRVGTYTSPHLVSVRERIAIQGEPISQGAFTEAFFELWERFSETARLEGQSAAEADGPASKPFFFRFLTILAWHVFLKERVDTVVLECGIGGEYDATNIVPSEAVSAAVVTQLGIDHVAMLGNTVEKIAWHKAGIFKPQTRGFVRDMAESPAVKEVLRSRAEENGAVLVEVGDGLVEQWGGVPGRLAGDFQKYNQALAVLAVRDHLGLGSHPTSALQDIPEKMLTGLKEASLRGRCETIQQGPVTWYLDGAHTRDSLEQVAKWFVPSLGAEDSVILVFNQQDRDAAVLLDNFLDVVHATSGRKSIFRHALFTTNDQHGPEGETRDLEVQQRAARTMHDKVAECHTAVFGNIEDTVAEARRISGEEGNPTKVLVTGSLHLVGGIMRALEPESLL